MGEILARVAKEKDIDERFPNLSKAIREDQDMWVDLQTYKKLLEKEYKDFYVSDVVAREESVRGQDSSYTFYESMRNFNENNIKVPASKIVEEREVVEKVKAYEGSFDTPEPSLAYSMTQDIATLRAIQVVAKTRYRIDPHMRSAIRGIVSYLFGNGIKINLADEEIEKKLKEKLDQIDIDTLFQDISKSTLLGGEGGILLRSKINRSKKTVEFSAQEVLSEEIQSLEVSSENVGINLTYGISRVNMDISGSKKSQMVKYIPDMEYMYALNSRGSVKKLDYTKSSKKGLSKNEVMVFIKFGNKRTLRGEPPVEPMLKPLRLHEDFVINRAILNYERSKVLYIRKRKTGSNPKLSQLNANKSKSPKGGTELTLYGGEDYTIQTASLNAADAKEDGLLFLHEAASGIGVPVSMISQRVDQGNYNSQKNAESPFGQLIIDYATFYTKSIVAVCRYILRRMAEAGEIPKDTTIRTFSKEQDETNMLLDIFKKIFNEKEDPEVIAKSLKAYKGNMTEIKMESGEIPVDVIIADAVRPNPLEMAKVWFIYRKLGIVSRQTLAHKANLVWEQEVYRMLKEAEVFPEPDNADSSAGGVSDKTNPTIDDPTSSSGATNSNVDPGDGTEL